MLARAYSLRGTLTLTRGPWQRDCSQVWERKRPRGVLLFAAFACSASSLSSQAGGATSGAPPSLQALGRSAGTPHCGPSSRLRRPPARSAWEAAVTARRALPGPCAQRHFPRRGRRAKRFSWCLPAAPGNAPRAVGRPRGVTAGRARRRSPPGRPPRPGRLRGAASSHPRPHSLPLASRDDPPGRRVETAAERLAAACRAPGARRRRAHGRRDTAAEEGKTGRWSGLTDEPAEHGVGVREPSAFLHASNAQLKTKVKNTQQWHRKNKILTNKDT